MLATRVRRVTFELVSGQIVEPELLRATGIRLRSKGGLQPVVRREHYDTYVKTGLRGGCNHA